MLDDVVDSPTSTRGLTRRTVVKGAAWTVPALMVATAAPAYAQSALACAPAGTLFDTEARGKLLGGQLLGINLDSVAEIEGATVMETAATPAAFQQLSAGLTVTALQALELELSGLATLLTSTLTTLVNQDAGAVAQWAYAHEQPGLMAGAERPGRSHGASGAVSDQTGAINFTQLQSSAPEFARIDLREILSQLTGDGVADLVANAADLELILGAVGAYSQQWSLCQTPSAAEVDRDYVIAYLRLLLESPAVGTLSTALFGTTEDPGPLGSITIDTATLLGVITEALGPIGSLLGTLLNQTLTASVTVAPAALTGQPIPNTQPTALQVDFNAGTVLLDLESLLVGGGYTGQLSNLLNQQPPNTRLFTEAQLPTGGITTVLRQWVVDSLLQRIRDVAQVTVQLGSSGGVLPTYLRLEGTLGEFLSGDATAVLRVAGLAVPGFDALVNGLLGGVGGLIEQTITTLLAPAGALNAVFDGVNAVLGSLFTVLQGVLSIVVNRQWEEAPLPEYGATNPLVQTPRFHEAAIHLEALGFANVLDLYLATAYSGRSTQRAV